MRSLDGYNLEGQRIVVVYSTGRYQVPAFLSCLILSERRMVEAARLVVTMMTEIALGVCSRYFS